MITFSEISFKTYWERHLILCCPPLERSGITETQEESFNTGYYNCKKKS